MTEDRIPMTYGGYLENRGLLPLGEEDLNAEGYLLEREDGAMIWYPEGFILPEAIDIEASEVTL